MKFFAVLALAGAALATDPKYNPCPSALFGNALCCATDALGVIGLDCDVPSETPRDAKHFAADCAKVGQQAKCCVLPVLDQAVLCDDPAGI